MNAAIEQDEIHMKKVNTKLQFKAATIRVLRDSELSRVAGGVTFYCTEQAGGCPGVQAPAGNPDTLAR